MIYKKRVLKNTCAGLSFLVSCKVEACNFIKKDNPAQCPSCRFSKMSKNTYFIELFQMAASVQYQFRFIEWTP